MSIPRFTAEASLYRTERHYSMVRANTTFTAQVVPAAPCCSPSCDHAIDLCEDCLDAGGSFTTCPWCRIANGICGVCIDC
jgi:hypothetical protein